MLKTKHEGGETIIAEGVKVEGQFASSGDVIIDGHVVGTVSAQGTIRVGERAHIEANVSAKSLFLSGTIVGDVAVEDHLELAPTSRLTGNVHARVLQLQAGCVLNGAVRMDGVSNKKTQADA
jgi:cytoskeletal protein CcmA (bactofilin family)